MSVHTELSASTVQSAPPLAQPRLRPARFDDYHAIQRLESSHGLLTPPQEDWRAVWLDNPLWRRLGSDWPIGWVLEDAGGRVVGSLSNVPSLYHFRRRELICANGRAWVVSSAYRGFALSLMDTYFNQPGADLFINTTVNAMAVETFSALSARVPLGDWASASFWVTGYRGFAKAALRILEVPLSDLLAPPMSVALRIRDFFRKKAFPQVADSVSVGECTSFDERFDSFWEELVQLHPDKLLAARDSRSLAWHFAVPLRAGRLWILTASRNGRLRAYCTVLRHDARCGMRRMRLIDYQSLEPDEDLLPALLRAALRRCAADNIYTLENLGSGVPKMREFDRLAPYRRKLLAWAFYYHAADPRLAAQLDDPAVWDPSTFDGDASFD